jgi:aspartate-semialdehyde dehydrogenase
VSYALAMRICILGATGLVGRESLDLVGRAWPSATLALYASRDQTTTHAGKEHPVLAAARLEEVDAPRGDLALVALDDDHSKRYVPRLLELGYRVVDKSNTYRADANVPLVAAGVNHDLVTAEVRLVANPNCTTIPLTLALAPLQRRFGLESAAVSTYQAISGAGVAALDQFLGESQRGYAESERLGLRFEPTRYAGNTVPHNGGTDASGFSSEERKLTFESRKILRLPAFPISAQCCRVPVAVGHYENAWVTLGKKASLEEIATVLGDTREAPFVRWLPGSAGEGLSALSGVHDRDRALVGRLRGDDRDATGRSLCLTVVGDNLRLGAATNAVRIASRWFPSADPDLRA